MNLVWKVVSSNPNPPIEIWVIKQGQKTRKWFKIISPDNHQKKNVFCLFRNNPDRRSVELTSCDSRGHGELHVHRAERGPAGHQQDLQAHRQL